MGNEKTKKKQEKPPKPAKFAEKYRGKSGQFSPTNREIVKAEFLRVLWNNFGMPTVSAVEVGLNEERIYQWKKDDDSFSKKWDEIREYRPKFAREKLWIKYYQLLSGLITLPPREVIMTIFLFKCELKKWDSPQAIQEVGEINCHDDFPKKEEKQPPTKKKENVCEK